MAAELEHTHCRQGFITISSFKGPRIMIGKLWLGGLCGIAALATGLTAAAGDEIVAGVPAVNMETPKNLESWSARRDEIRKTLWQLLGDLPPRPAKLNVRVVERTRRPEGFTVERIEFDNGAGATVPGYVCLPEKILGTQHSALSTQHLAEGRAPAILYCHQHAGLYDKGGKEELFETRPTPIPPAADLTKRGYIVLAIDAYGFGERAGKGPWRPETQRPDREGRPATQRPDREGGTAEKGSAEELTLSKLNLWLGRTLWGMMIRDDLIALDYLASRPEVDPARIGVMGFSMGSTRAWWIAALDDRPRATVCVCCLTRYQDLIAAGELRAHGIYYFVPNVLKHFDTEAIVALIAPRPLLTLTGDRDSGSPVAGVRKINAFCGDVYKLYGKGDCFRGLLYEGVAHTYTPAMWDEMTAWIEKWLK
jgi:dienelactone hydrolase